MLTKKQYHVISAKSRRQLKNIAKYWEDKNTVSIIDKNVKILELNTVKSVLAKNDSIIDIGCGDGKSAYEYSKLVKEIYCIDNSQNMLNKAMRFTDKKCSNLIFERKDILNLKSIGQKFDVAITDRVICNLPSWELQQRVILDIKTILKKKGRYVMLEDFDDGYKKMNKFRKLMGLKPISKHWHNTYLKEKKLLSFVKNHFNIVKKFNFNVYYFLTRVYVPMFASFTGFGKMAKSDPIFKKSDLSARRITEKLSSELDLFENEFFGTIGGLLLQKK